MGFNFAGDGGLDAGMELKQQQGTDKFLSSYLKENNEYRLFVPIFKKADGKVTVATANVVGRSLDYDALGYSFTLVDYVKNEQNVIIDVTGLDSLARISTVLYEAEYACECMKANRDAEQTARDLRRDVDVVSLNTRLKELDAEYHGTVVNDKKIMPKKNHAVGGISVYIATNLAVLKMEGEDKPESVQPQRVALILTGPKSKMLANCLKKVTEEDVNRGFIELVYKYEGSSKQEAGMMSKFEYVEPRNWLQNKCQDYWTKNAADLKEHLLYDQEAIAMKNRNLAYSPAVQDVFMAFKKYAKDVEMTLPYIDTKASATKSAAKDMLEYEVFTSYEELNKALIELASDAPVEKEEEKASEVVSELANETDAMDAVEKMGVERYDEASAFLGAEDDQIGQL